MKLTPAGDEVLVRVMTRQVEEVRRQGRDLRRLIEVFDQG